MALDGALDRLIAIWDHNDAYWTEHLAEPASAQEVRDVLGALGYPVSDEVVSWFSWRGGVAHLNRRVGPALESMSTQEALAYRVMNLDISETMRVEADEPPEAGWQPSWLPVVNLPHGGNFAADLAAGDSTTSTVWRYDESGPPRQVAASVEAMVSGWIDLIEGGYWRWNPQHRLWENGPNRPSEPLAGLDV